jgi:hypothetical protein
MLFEATASLACCAFKADKADPKILAEKFVTYKIAARPIPTKQKHKGLEALPKQARACRLVGWLNPVYLMD